MLIVKAVSSAIGRKYVVPGRLADHLFSGST